MADIRERATTGQPDGFVVIGDQGAEECEADGCDCFWFEPAADGCACGHSIVEHKESDDDEEKPL